MIEKKYFFYKVGINIFIEMVQYNTIFLCNLNFIQSIVKPFILNINIFVIKYKQFVKNIYIFLEL